MGRVRDKTASHERIVRAAAQKIRSEGVARLSVAALMGEAGLTHGGFYRHFDSREDLIDAAVTAALTDGSRYTSATDESTGDPLSGIVNAYLSPTHRDEPENGCAVAALSADVARASSSARAAYTQRVRTNIQALTEALEQKLGLDEVDARKEAITTLAAMVGAVVMARAATGELSDELLSTTREALIDRTAEGQSANST